MTGRWSFEGHCLMVKRNKIHLQSSSFYLQKVCLGGTPSKFCQCQDDVVLECGWKKNKLKVKTIMSFHIRFNDLTFIIFTFHTQKTISIFSLCQIGLSFSMTKVLLLLLRFFVEMTFFGLRTKEYNSISFESLKFNEIRFILWSSESFVSNF